MMQNNTRTLFLAISHQVMRGALMLLSLVFIGHLMTATPAFAQKSEVEAPASSNSKATTTIVEKMTSSATDQFNSEREARLEDLRYKHLWIAYSLVWIIIFLFIRQTWQRSQAVRYRLDELKSRLVKLEESEEK